MPSEETLKYSMNKLKQSKTRSMFTTFSILVGIATIFVFISFGIGLYNYVDQFSTSGAADKFTVMPKGMSAPGLDESFLLAEKDISAIEQASGVSEVSPLYAKAAEVKQNKIKKYAFLIGYDPEKPIIFEMSNIGLYKGRWLKKDDSGKVMLGYNYLVKDRIFPRTYDVNDKIEIQGREMRIAGFLDSVGNPQDDSQIYTTTDYMEEIYRENLTGYNWVVARADLDSINNVIKRVESALRDSRNVEEGKEDFFVQSWQSMMETYSNVLNGIIGFIVFIALISVVVSAINTANTMITSVLERTKEIGVMKAVGATNSEIFKIFLFESAFLGFAAGVGGILAGFAVTQAVAVFVAKIGWNFLQPYYSWWLFCSLVLFATATGAVSGALPAYRASRVNPVQALRYE